MGNTHGGVAGHHHEQRRKSRQESASASSMASEGQRRPSGGGGPALFSVPTPVKNSEEIGPLSIHAASGVKSAPGCRVQPHRPRATTEVGKNYGRFMKQMSTDASTSRYRDSGEVVHPVLDENGQGGHHAGMPTIFKYSGNAKEVYVCGSFNGWQKLPMSRSTKDFVAIVDLKEGEHEYKFLVDGQWTNDPSSTDHVERDGYKNNVIRVQKEDFNAYDALDMDSAAVSKLNASKKLRNGNNGFGGLNGTASKDEYGQVMPSPASVFEQRSGPPILPPHLLQVILNKDTPLTCEPTLLPEPNHVMINHLYALSIKDGVMVLSATQRYKKKYVTTLLYKPMGSRRD